MKLNELFEDVGEIEIQSLMADSRKKRPNSIFFCEKGMMNDGHRFVDQAIENGAIVIVHSEPLPVKVPGITYIKVKNVNQVYNRVADAFYGYPSHKLLMYRHQRQKHDCLCDPRCSQRLPANRIYRYDCD